KPRGTVGGNGETPFSPPKCEAAGTVSRRLHYFSKNQVENRGLVRTSVKAASGGKCRYVNEFAPEVARHQKVADPANFRFDSRRLHFDSPPSCLRQAGGSLMASRRQREASRRQGEMP